MCAGGPSALAINARAIPIVAASRGNRDSNTVFDLLTTTAQQAAQQAGQIRAALAFAAAESAQQPRQVRPAALALCATAQQATQQAGQIRAATLADFAAAQRTQ